MAKYGKINTVEELGALIRRRRKEAGYRQADAAALAGVGTRFLSELERGKESAEIGLALQVLQRVGLDVWVAPRGVDPTSVSETPNDAPAVASADDAS